MLCWGRNAEGQIGDGTLERRAAPTLVQGLNGVATLAAGFQHTCVLRNDQSVFCWGKNSAGQLGFAGDDSARPRRVVAPAPVTTLSAMWDHSCATMSGVAACWGANEHGQLGTNSREASRPPSIVAGLARVDFCRRRLGSASLWSVATPRCFVLGSKPRRAARDRDAQRLQPGGAGGRAARGDRPRRHRLQPQLRFDERGRDLVLGLQRAWPSRRWDVDRSALAAARLGPLARRQAAMGERRL